MKSELRLFYTTQDNIVVPTKELIKEKNTDFRVLLALSTISNVDDYTLEGDNSRFLSLNKGDMFMNTLSKNIGITTSQFRKHLNALLKHNSDEFKVVEREYNGSKVLCYEINYQAGGFVTIPYEKVEKLIVGLSNNCIKLYINLLWLCQNNGKFIERNLTQDYLLELMGLSKSSKRALRIAVEILEENKLIKTRKETVTETILIDGEIRSSAPKTIIHYSIYE
ncbi:hypothetical protein Q3258_16845 [Clostridioides difficile]